MKPFPALILALLVTACGGSSGGGGDDDSPVHADARPEESDAGLPACQPADCQSPPAPACVDGALRTYDATGSCGAEGCEYAFSDASCAHGCVDAACAPECLAGEPGACQSPPADACAGDLVRHYQTAGSCADGSCSYAFVDQACSTPPPAECLDGSTLRTYAAAGSCQDGACSYQSSTMTCASGCADGACFTPGHFAIGQYTSRSCQSWGGFGAIHPNFPGIVVGFLEDWDGYGDIAPTAEVWIRGRYDLFPLGQRPIIVLQNDPCCHQAARIEVTYEDALAAAMAIQAGDGGWDIVVNFRDRSGNVTTAICEDYRVESTLVPL